MDRSSPTNPVEQLKSHLQQKRLWRGPTHLKRGGFLHQSGDRNDNVYIVNSGCLRIYVGINDGEEQIIRFAYAGDAYSAIDCLLTGQPTMLYARAIRATELLVVPKTVYQAHVIDNPELAGFWAKTTSWMIVSQLEREVDLLTKDPSERYRRVLARSPRLFQEVPAKYIANYLRMTPETLSRVRSGK